MEAATVTGAAMLKFFVLRTHRGQVIDLAKPGAAILAGVGGTFEILRSGDGTIRVSIDGVQCTTEAGVNYWPTFLSDGPHAVLVELIRDEAVADSKPFTVEVKPCPNR